MQEKEKQKKQARKKELYNTTKVKEAARAKKEIKENDAGTAQKCNAPPNHLQVALAGSRSASRTSLGSISNGHLKTSLHDVSDLNSPESDPKSNVQSPESPKSPDSAPVNSSANYILNGKKTQPDVSTPNIKSPESPDENDDQKNFNSHINDEEFGKTVAYIDDIMDEENKIADEVGSSF